MNRFIFSLTRNKFKFFQNYLSTTNCLRNTKNLLNQSLLCSQDEKQNYVIKNICNEISNPLNRLFAVIYINGKQFKVSQDDIIHLEDNLLLDVGETIKFEKVLLIGSKSFTLFGRPLLDSNSVNVQAVVIEKTTTSPEIKYDCLLDDVHNVQWLSRELTVLRINSISLNQTVFSK